MTDGLVDQRDEKGMRTLALITAGNRELVERALASFDINFREFSHPIETIVFDDLAGSDARGAAIAHRRIHGGSTLYAGRREKISFCARLVERGIPADVAEYALLGDSQLGGCSTGANRNCSLLDTVGELFVTVDDDMVCRMASHSNQSSALRLSGQVSPKERWVFPDRGSVFAAAQWSNIDFIGQQEGLLGRSLTDLTAEWRCKGLEVDTQSACVHQRNDLGYGRGWVCGTMPGIIGESGESSWTTTVFSQAVDPGCSRESEEERYRPTQPSREIIGISPSVVLTHHSMCMAGSLGLDNRRVLPPFLPNFRNQDGVFGALVMRCLPGAYWAHLPFGILHDRRGPSPGSQGASGVRVSEMIIALINGCSSLHDGLSAQGALKTLGLYLLELADLGKADFYARTGSCVQQQLIDRHSYFLNAQVESAGHTKRTCPDLEEYRTILKRIIDGDLLRLDDLGSGDQADSIPTIQRIVGQTGKLLRHWPEIVARSRDLRAEGIRISVPVE